MKKTTMMRIATTLLVAVLVTTCALGATFAKYVTASSEGDEARVAKWNIMMDNTGSDLFEYTYGDPADVLASDGATNLVAPGTTNVETFKVTGAPETDYIISFDASGIKDIYLGAGTYSYNQEGTDDYLAAMTQTVENNYYPIKYYITIDTKGLGTINGGIFEENTESQAYRTLEEALGDLNETTISYEANEEAGLTVTIRWEWLFDNTTDNYQNDAYDTILGDLIEGSTNELVKSENADYRTNVTYTLKVTATQVCTENPDRS